MVTERDLRKPNSDPPQEYIQRVIDLAIKAWDGDIAEFRVISNRNGASVLPSKREYFKETTER